MIEQGVFGDVDVALQIHPSDRTSAEIVCLAITDLDVTFHGKLAHASSDPWLGKNALDALVLLYTMVAQWRQHLKPGERVHGIITHGGAAPNIVPDLTSGRWFLRTPIDEDLEPMIDRFREMAEAAALATGTTVEVTEAPNRMRTMVNNQTLLEIWRRELDGRRLAGRSDRHEYGQHRHGKRQPRGARPSTPMMAIAPEGTPGHSREFAAYAAGPGGDEMLPIAIRVLAATGIELLRNPDLVERAWTELNGQGGGRQRT